jgi:hypothetical protein
LQTHGSKRWEVAGPLPGYEKPTEALQRGKNEDVVFPREEPFLDVTLTEGDVLYVPRGFLHRTHGGASQGSVSLTVSISTETAGLAISHVALCALHMQGYAPTAQEWDALTSSYAELRSDLGVGVPDYRPITDAVAAAVDVAWPIVSSAPFASGRATRRPDLARLARFVEDAKAAAEEAFRSAFDASIPVHLQQKVFARRTEGLLYSFLGRCGFLTTCPPKRFWIRSKLRAIGLLDPTSSKRRAGAR